MDIRYNNKTNSITDLSNENSFNNNEFENIFNDDISINPKIVTRSYSDHFNSIKSSKKEKERSMSLEFTSFTENPNRRELPPKTDRNEVIDAYLEIPGIVKNKLKHKLRNLKFKTYQNKLVIKSKYI